MAIAKMHTMLCPRAPTISSTAMAMCGQGGPPAHPAEGFVMGTSRDRECGLGFAVLEGPRLDEACSAYSRGARVRTCSGAQRQCTAAAMQHNEWDC